MLIKLKNKISQSRSISQQFKLVGMSGILVVMFWNILGQSVFQLHEAAFFQSQWWSTWFPNYSVWLGLVIMGFLIKHKENNSEISM